MMATETLKHGLTAAELAEFRSLSRTLMCEMTNADLERYGELRAKIRLDERVGRATDELTALAPDEK